MNLKRLRQMSADEITHRFWEQCRRTADLVRFRCSIGIDEDREFDALVRNHGSSLKNYLSREIAPRFYPAVRDRAAMSGLIRKRFPDWFDRAIGDAGLLCEHRVHLLGHGDTPLGAQIDWHHDAISGYDWPRKFWTGYELVDTPRSDAKVVHELNRHQHLPRLGKAFFLTGDELYAREAIAQIESWIAQNPKWVGINWQSSLEIGLRAISWIWTICFLLESDSLDETVLRRIVRCLFAQLDQVYRYPSVYSSPNTHLLGEAAALFIAGVLFRELPRAGKWREFGARTLIYEMRRQVFDDGVYRELSSYYHCYAADFYLHALTLAKWNSVAFPEEVWIRLSQMFDFVLHITRPDGTIPLLGDDDGGRVLMLGAEDYRSYRDGLCSGAVIFGRGDFKGGAGDFCEDTLWLLGADALPIFNALATEMFHEQTRMYRDAGYAVQRSGGSDKDTHLLFDFGGLGIPTGGHGHADALSFTLFSGGREILIDPGTSVYNCARDWREYFRSTEAHNTVVVDGTSQSSPGGTFSWKRKARTRLLHQFSLPEFDYIEAEHDGYAHITKGVIHRRRMIYIRPNYWIILDDLRGTGKHDFDFLYHFAADASLTILGEEKRGEIDCRTRIGDAGLQLLLYASGPVRAEVECGVRRPIQGWSSIRYGERHPSPVMRASLRGVPPVSMMSFLIPGTGAAESRRIQANSSETIAATIRDGDCDDVAVTAAVDGDLHVFDCTMRGDFFWLRMQNGNLVRLLAVNAYSFRCGGETVFESKQPVPYVQAYFWENGIVIEHGQDSERKVYVRDLRDRQFQRH